MAAFTSLSSCKWIIVGLSAIAALIAAILWRRACVVAVPATQHINQRPGEFTDSWDGGVIANDHKGRSYDVIATLVKQGEWNRYAALAACCSAALQGLALLIPG